MKILPFKLDPHKLEQEDRKFLMERSLTFAATSVSNMLNNTAVYLAILSLLISTFSITYSINEGFTRDVIIFGIVEFVIFLIVTILFKKANAQAKKQKKMAEDGHNLMFEIHFEYAKENLSVENY